MPVRRGQKWAGMEAGESTLSNEWHGMEPSDPRFSEKWVDMTPQPAKMSEKWVEMENPSDGMGGTQWNEMKQEGRMDPYAMHHSDGNRSVGMKDMKKQVPDNKRERKTQHDAFGSTREI